LFNQEEQREETQQQVDCYHCYHCYYCLKMPSTRSGRSSTPIGHNNPEATIPLMDPTAPSFETAPGRNDTIDVTEALNVVDMTTAGTMPATTWKVHTLACCRENHLLV
jgi:hypothetical protein